MNIRILSLMDFRLVCRKRSVMENILKIPKLFTVSLKIIQANRKEEVDFQRQIV